MSLKWKVVLLLLGVFCLFVTASHAVQRFVVFPSFVALEQNEAAKDMERCLDAIRREIEHLSIFCGDWAAWNDTYEFVVDGNEAYKESNLMPTTFSNNHLNLFYACDLTGRVVWGEVRDLETMETISLSVFAGPKLDPQSRFFAHDGLRSTVEGIVLTERGPMMVTSRPIITSELTGPIRGVLIMGRFLNDEAVSELCARTHVAMSVRPVTADNLSTVDRAALARLTDGRPMLMQNMDNRLDVYSVYTDLDGRPALLVKAEIPRDISAHGLTAMRFAMFSDVGAGILILLLMWIMLQAMVVGPLGVLGRHARCVGETDDVSLHFALPRRDEIGALSREFDRMVSRLAEARAKLLDTARRAGMAEIASGVLHNVGNVLNSVNVSAGRAVEKVRKFDVPDLAEVASLMESKGGELGNFLTADERGRLIPQFLAELARHLTSEQETILGELAALTESVEHIREIVDVQQTYAAARNTSDKVAPTALADDALRINAAAMARHRVEVKRHYADVPDIITDRHKVLQILINLLSNAKYAIDERGAEERTVTVRVGPDDEAVDRIRIDVIDTGVGIPPENMRRIFAHGFTTRSKGHGFGLHTAALAATTLGGTLTAHSDGPGRGATFTLRLPIQPVEAAI